MPSIQPGNISIAAAFVAMVVFKLPPCCDLCFFIQRFFVLTIPAVNDVVLDGVTDAVCGVRDGGGGYLHTFDKGRGRGKNKLVGNDDENPLTVTVMHSPN